MEMQDKRDSGLEGCRRRGIQDWRDAGEEGFRTGGMKEKRDSGLEGCRRRGSWKRQKERRRKGWRLDTGEEEGVGGWRINM